MQVALLLGKGGRSRRVAHLMSGAGVGVASRADLLHTHVSIGACLVPLLLASRVRNARV